MRCFFEKAFNSDAIKNTNIRHTELECTNTLIRFRNKIIKCLSGNEIFLDQNEVQIMLNLLKKEDYHQKKSYLWK